MNTRGIVVAGVASAASGAVGRFVSNRVAEAIAGKDPVTQGAALAIDGLAGLVVEAVLTGAIMSALGEAPSFGKLMAISVGSFAMRLAVGNSSAVLGQAGIEGLGGAAGFAVFYGR